MTVYLILLYGTGNLGTTGARTQGGALSVVERSVEHGDRGCQKVSQEQREVDLEETR